MRPRISIALAALTLLAFVPVLPTAWGDEGQCDADVEVNLEREGTPDDPVQLEFEVEVTTSAGCADIEYDLIVEEQLPNGQAKNVRKTRQVKLDDGSLTEIVRYQKAAGVTVLSYEAKVVWCRSCEAP